MTIFPKSRPLDRVRGWFTWQHALWHGLVR